MRVVNVEWGFQRCHSISRMPLPFESKVITHCHCHQLQEAGSIIANSSKLFPRAMFEKASKCDVQCLIVLTTPRNVYMHIFTIRSTWYRVQMSQSEKQKPTSLKNTTSRSEIGNLAGENQTTNTFSFSSSLSVEDIHLY